MDKFDIGEWRNRQIDEEFESSFNINPSLAHKIWEIIQEQMMKVDKEKDNYKGGYKDDGDYAEKWLEVFPTASGFFHFINNKLKKQKLNLEENQENEINLAKALTLGSSDGQPIWLSKAAELSSICYIIPARMDDDIEAILMGGRRAKEANKDDIFYGKDHFYTLNPEKLDLFKDRKIYKVKLY